MTLLGKLDKYHINLVDHTLQWCFSSFLKHCSELESGIEHLGLINYWKDVPASCSQAPGLNLELNHWPSNWKEQDLDTFWPVWHGPFTTLYQTHVWIETNFCKFYLQILLSEFAFFDLLRKIMTGEHSFSPSFRENWKEQLLEVAASFSILRAYF